MQAFDPTKFGAQPITPPASAKKPTFDPTRFGAAPVDQAPADAQPAPAAEPSLLQSYLSQPGKAWEAGKAVVSNLAAGEYDKAAGKAGEAIGAVGATLLPLGVAALTRNPVLAARAALAGTGTWGNVARAGAQAAGVAGIGAASGAAAQYGAQELAKAAGAGEGLTKLAGEAAGWTALPGTAMLTQRWLSKLAPRGTGAATAPEALVKEFQRKRDIAEGNVTGQSVAPRVPAAGMGVMEKLKANFIQEEAPVLDYAFNRKKQTQGTDEAWRFYNELENATARAKRPTTEADAIHTEIGLLDIMPEIGKLSSEGVSGYEKLGQYMRARQENWSVQSGKSNHLPGTEGDPAKMAERMQKNAALIEAYQPVFEPYLSKLAHLNARNAQLSLEGGFTDINGYAAMMQNIWNRAKQSPILQEEDKMLLLDLGDKYRSAVGVGANPSRRLDRVMELEALHPLQAGMQETQRLIQAKNKNSVLQKIASEATPGDADAAPFAQPKDFSELTLLSSKPRNSLSTPVFFNGREMHLTGPTDLIASMKMYGAQDPAEVNGALETLKTAAQTLNRTKKMFLTGTATAPQFMIMGRALNWLAVMAAARDPLKIAAYTLQNLPLAAKQSGLVGAMSNAAQTLGAKPGGAVARMGFNPAGDRWMGMKLDTDLLRRAQREAAVATSAELYRNTGDQDAELAMLSGAPLAERVKFAITDPAQEIAKRVMGMEANKRIMGQPVRVAKDLMTGVENALTFDEQALRLGVFKAEYNRRLKEGLSEQDAAEAAGNAARNLLGNFSIKGRIGWVPELISPYFNAIIQGQRGMYNYIRQNPKPFAMRAIGGAAVMGWLAHRAYTDPEMKDVIDGTSPEERSKYMYAKTGPIERDGQGRVTGGIVRLPVPEPWRLINGFSQSLAKTIDDQGLTQEVLGEMFLMMANNVSPVAVNESVPETVGEWGANVPLLGPLAEVGINRQMYSGMPIVSTRNAQRVPAPLRQAFGAVPATKLWYVAKQQLPILRLFEQQARGDRRDPGADMANPWSRFTRSSMAYRGQQRKQRAIEERIERESGN